LINAGHVNMWLDKLKSSGVNLWYRYVIDIFATLNSRGDAENILAFLNNQHPKMRLTIEHEESGQLHFMDTLVKRCVGKNATTVYQKKTFTGVYLNWTSLTGKRFNIGLIKCLTKRVLRICTNEDDRVQQLRKVKLLLLRNQYPADVIDKKMDDCIRKDIGTRMATQLTPEESKRKKFVTLPYTIKKCEDFAAKLCKLSTRATPSIEMNVAYQAPKKIGDFFPIKIKWNFQKSRRTLGTIWNARNVKQTTSGRLNRSWYTDWKNTTKDDASACHRHAIENPGHHIDFSKVEMIDQVSNYMKLCIKELIIIQKKPTLNKQHNSQSGFELKTLLVQAYPQFQTSN